MFLWGPSRFLFTTGESRQEDNQTRHNHSFPLQEFLPHTFIYNGKLTEGENDVWGLPPFEYPNLAKVETQKKHLVLSCSSADLSSRRPELRPGQQRPRWHGGSQTLPYRLHQLPLPGGGAAGVGRGVLHVHQAAGWEPCHRLRPRDRQHHHRYWSDIYWNLFFLTFTNSAVGFSGTGFKLAPVTGNMIADMATGVNTRQDVEMLSLRRWNEEKAKL